MTNYPDARCGRYSTRAKGLTKLREDVESLGWTLTQVRWPQIVDSRPPPTIRKGSFEAQRGDVSVSSWHPEKLVEKLEKKGAQLDTHGRPAVSTYDGPHRPGRAGPIVKEQR